MHKASYGYKSPFRPSPTTVNTRGYVQRPLAGPKEPNLGLRKPRNLAGHNTQRVPGKLKVKATPIPASVRPHSYVQGVVTHAVAGAKHRRR